MNLEEKTLQRPDGTLHYWIGGKRGAPLVVLTHGATIDHHEWDATLPLLADKYQILTWDVRSHGLSRPMPFVFSEAESDLLALMDKIKANTVTFIGHSMGGNLHQEFVFHHPERVKSMVFLDCTWNFQKLTSIEKLGLSIAKPLFEIYPYKLLIDQSLAVTAVSQTSKILLRASINNLTKDEFIQIMMGTATCLHYESGYKIGKPLLLMVGEKDGTGNIRKAMPAWSKVEPDCRIYVVPKAMHAANLDNPGYFHNILLMFLEEVHKR